MSLFQDADSARAVIGGFLQGFERLDPVFREVTGDVPMVMKVELTDPEMTAEIDLAKRPLAVRFDQTTHGNIGLVTTSDDFHLLMMGVMPLAVGINHKRILVRGSAAKLVAAAPLIYLAPYIYPFYLEAIGRADLVTAGARPLLHGDRRVEGNMNWIMGKLAFIAGYSMGMIKSRISPGLDVLAALESLGLGLRSASPAQMSVPADEKKESAQSCAPGNSEPPKR